jgi:hypothetical protein
VLQIPSHNSLAGSSFAVGKGEKHHYIPQFYLNRWAGTDGRLCEYSRPYDIVKPKFVHPSGTGYERGLYPRACRSGSGTSLPSCYPRGSRRLRVEGCAAPAGSPLLHTLRHEPLPVNQWDGCAPLFPAGRCASANISVRSFTKTPISMTLSNT